MSIRQPGRYGSTFHLSEHRVCAKCNESELRLDARFCCWCGTRFDVVIIERIGYSTRMVVTQPKTIAAEDRIASQTESHHTND
jgi:hypothetical protein